MAVITPADQKDLTLNVDAAVELARMNLAAIERDVSKFAQNSDRSLAQAEKGFARLEKATGMARTAVLGFVSALSVSTVVSFGRSMLNFADDLATAAQQAGVSIERYQTLQEALRALELSTDQTDKVLKTLVDTLGAVQSGTAAKGATDALDRMGITQQILNGHIRDAGQLLDAIAQSSSRYKSEAMFTADVVALLGRRIGVDLAAAIRDGGKALHELEQQTRDTGTVIDTELVNKLADANESVDRMMSAMRRNAVLWAGEFISAVEGVGNALDRFQNKLTLNSPLASGAARARAFEALSTDDKLAAVDRRLTGLRTQQARARRGMGYNVLTGAVTGGTSATSDLDYRIAQTEKYRARIAAEGLSEISRGFWGSNSAPPPPPQTFDPPKTSRSAGSAGKKAQRVFSAHELRMGADLTPGKSTISPELEALRLADLGAMAKSVAKTVDGDLAPSLLKVQTMLPQIDVGSVLSVEDQERLERFAADFAANFESAFENALFNGDLRGAVDGLIEDFGRLIIRLTLIEPAARKAAQAIGGMGGGGGLFGGLLKLVGLAGGGGGPMLSAGFNPGPLVDLAKVVPLTGLGFAGGGRPPVGKASWVGERGRELFVPDVPGRIIANDNLGGSRVVNNYINGNLLTPEFWAKIQAGDDGAAIRGSAGGARMAQRQIAQAGRRTLR